MLPSSLALSPLLWVVQQASSGRRKKPFIIRGKEIILEWMRALLVQ